jgi:hypothetical protein
MGNHVNGTVMKAARLVPEVSDLQIRPPQIDAPGVSS